ncbi:transporter substrate-binding domain-containing protein [Zooshikella marina]|uniref:substrate-binding periplasmic protein n=1 Tax=Zooshikella ganghwensis TaxID=202772 RepID=UPI001BAF26CF|nr:transporter substrate-binding domain-containing protein [Zooshikella ganghwensis]MBU2707900.1 transporter substrate-binding domain-containing protein [Zooshikella ganghwensis]
MNTWSNAPLSLAASHNFPPYSFLDEEGNLSGIDIDITNKIMKLSEIQFFIELKPISRIEYLIKNKKVDAVITTTPHITETISNSMWFSNSLYNTTLSLFINSKNKEILNQKLSYNKVCQRTGFLNGSILTSPEFSSTSFIDVRSVNYVSQLVDLLTLGRVDCVIAEDIAFIYQAKEMKKQDQVLLIKEITDRDIFIGLQESLVKRRPELPLKIDKAISELHKNHAIDDIIIKYLQLPLKKAN